MFDAFEQILPSGAPRMPLWTAWSHVGDLLCTGFGKVLVIDAEDRMAGCLMHILRMPDIQQSGVSGPVPMASHRILVISQYLYPLW